MDESRHLAPAWQYNFLSQAGKLWQPKLWSPLGFGHCFPPSSNQLRSTSELAEGSPSSYECLYLRGDPMASLHLSPTFAHMYARVNPR